ncbi:MAG TPA: helix-turn-helix domain-containing protein, partial [Acidimicrobiia bacterium]|nr:helix-turn-helix domain-containing protein [Acidimicrobiia bacterium]
DAARLERLGAVLRMAGQRVQVIVLTCVPDRYRNVGSATVIKLAAADGKAGDGSSAAGDSGSAALGPAPEEDGGPESPADAGGGEGPWAARLLECLAEAGGPLGRSEIIARSGIPEGSWQATITHLLRQGRVVKEGAKRGARYRLPSA